MPVPCYLQLLQCIKLALRTETAVASLYTCTDRHWQIFLRGSIRAVTDRACSGRALSCPSRFFGGKKLFYSVAVPAGITRRRDESRLSKQAMKNRGCQPFFSRAIPATTA
jgi:hypothetical protein